MLKKLYRLSNVEKRIGKTIDSPFFKLKLIKSGESNPKFAFVISKKIDKRAVYRNRIKRSLAKIVARILLDIKPGHNFIFVVKKEILGKQQKDLEKIVKDVFIKQNLLR
ncbi:MAG: ribonuclease P protein component [Candidatus Levybacteria bacterium]|nr:ribonuclease P protein component [Candidatus Levybacteria bacterium]